MKLSPSGINCLRYLSHQDHPMNTGRKVEKGMCSQANDRALERSPVGSDNETEVKAGSQAEPAAGSPTFL